MSNVTPIHQNLIEWCQAQFEASGITSRVDHAGMSIYTKDPAGFSIQYFDMHGEIIPGHIRIRCRENDDENPDDRYDIHHRKPKYRDPKGQKQKLYWPRLYGLNHPAIIGNMENPLFICEGEKKALRLCDELLRLGIEGTAIAVPGIRFSKELLHELSGIPMKAVSGKVSINRKVFLVFDHNDRGKAEGLTRKGEYDLLAFLTTMGADPIILRWEVPPDAGVQKIDDWLQAGGDLPAAITYSIQNKNDTVDGMMKLLLQLNEDWAMYNGRFTRISGPNRGDVLSTQQFMNETAHLFIMVPVNDKLKKVKASSTWIEWNAKRTMSGFCFLPVGLGKQVQPWVGDKLNVAKPWATVPDTLDDLMGDGPELPVHLPRKLLSNFGNEEEVQWLTDWIAHGVLRPQEKTSQCVAILDNGGTGKGLLFESLKILSGESNLVGTLEIDRKDAFNGELAGRLFCNINELQKGFKEKDLEAINKRYVGSETLTINEKQQPIKEVANYLRLIYTLNMRYPFHIAKDDRRMNVFSGKERIGPPCDGPTSGNGFAIEYCEFMKSDVFIQTWLAVLSSSDLENYNPHMLGPESEHRKRAIGFSQTHEEAFFESDRFADKGVWTCQELFMAFMEEYPRDRMDANSLAKISGDYGWTKRQISMAKDSKPRLLGAPGWAEKDNEAWRAEVKKAPTKY